MTARSFSLPQEADTQTLAAQMAPHLQGGDCLLLKGPLGAGKSVFARAVITAFLAEEERREDIPSPTYTLVQTYETTRATLWHADLFRLSDPEETLELGLDEAIARDITLIEWPERLGPYQPARHLALTFDMGQGENPADEPGRILTITANGPGWDWLSEVPQ